MIEASGRTLLALIDDILDLSKIEAHKITLENVAFDLRRIVEDAFQTLRPRANAKGLAFTWHATPEAPALLFGDPNRLRQILINLTANAIKFTERGDVVLRVGMERKDTDKVTLRFSISDTGIGIEPGPGPCVILAVRSGGHIHYAQVWRHRAGVVYFQTTGRDDGGQNRFRQQGRRRFHILVYRHIRHTHGIGFERYCSGVAASPAGPRRGSKANIPPCAARRPHFGCGR